MDEGFHHCPAHKNFQPDVLCSHHLECNDPVTRCFLLAKKCSQFAEESYNYAQEYRDGESPNVRTRVCLCLDRQRESKSNLTVTLFTIPVQGSSGEEQEAGSGRLRLLRRR